MADYTFNPGAALVVPDTATLQADVEAEFRDVFGQDLVTTPDTPQGVLITAEVLARDAVVRNNAAIANQINPDLAGGSFLDALWALCGGGRTAATKSTLAAVNLAGVAGTVVPAGSRASTAAGVLFETVSAVTLGAGGTASVNFVAVDYGPIAVTPGALNTVSSAVLGWETVSNPTAATLGALEESDAAARKRRALTLALQGTALPEAITSGLYDVEGVKSLSFRENKGASTATIDGVSMAAHSVYACIDGGTDAAVAAVLLSRSSMGAGFNGGVTVNITGPHGQTYPVKFDRPTAIPVRVRAYVKVLGANLDAQSIVAAAILAYTSGQSTVGAGFVVGAPVSPFELAAAVNTATPTVYVQKIEVTKSSVGVFAVAEIPIAIFEIATLSEVDIEVFTV